jgi:hypothetical protein
MSFDAGGLIIISFLSLQIPWVTVLPNVSPLHNPLLDFSKFLCSLPLILKPTPHILSNYYAPLPGINFCII